MHAKSGKTFGGGKSDPGCCSGYDGDVVAGKGWMIHGFHLIFEGMVLDGKLGKLGG